MHAPAEVLAPSRVRAHDGLLARRGVPAGAGICDGARVTSPLHAAWDLGRRLDLVEAVVAVDALAAAGRKRPTFVPHPPGVPVPPSVMALSRKRGRCPGLDPAALLGRRRALPGARGARGLDRVALADPRAGSPPETRLRLLLVLAGLPAPAVQHPLVDALGQELVRFDLAYPEAMLAIEYDGDDALDRHRDLMTSALGWHTLRLLRHDLVVTPEATIAVVRTLHTSRQRLMRTQGYTTAGHS